jgi:hypothetical protein
VPFLRPAPVITLSGDNCALRRCPCRKHARTRVASKRERAAARPGRKRERPGRKRERARVESASGWLRWLLQGVRRVTAPGYVGLQQHAGVKHCIPRRLCAATAGEDGAAEGGGRAPRTSRGRGAGLDRYRPEAACPGRRRPSGEEPWCRRRGSSWRLPAHGSRRFQRA